MGFMLEAVGHPRTMDRVSPTMVPNPSQGGQAP